MSANESRPRPGSGSVDNTHTNGTAQDRHETADALFEADYVVRTGYGGERIVEVDYRIGPERRHPVPSIVTAGQNADPEWAAETWSVILDLADSGVEFSNDDVRARVTRRPHHPNAWGAAMRRAAGAGLIVRAGSAPSRQQSRAGSYTSTWRGRA